MGALFIFNIIECKHKVRSACLAKREWDTLHKATSMIPSGKKYKKTIIYYLLKI